MRILEAKRLILCAALLPAILIVGCDTFSDLVPGIQALKQDNADLRADLTGLIETGNPVDKQAAEAILTRLEPIESHLTVIEDEATERGDQQIDLGSLVDMGLEYAGYAGVPGMGLLGLLWRNARKTTENVVRGVESARDGNGGVDWEKLDRIHSHTGVSNTVEKIRNKHKAAAKAAKVAAGGAVKAT